MRMANFPLFTLIPANGTLERKLFDFFLSCHSDIVVVPCLAKEFGTDAEAILQAVNNLRHGMFEAENDHELTYDA